MKCGPTHYAGCACHEKQWREKLEKAERERDESRRLFESSKSARKSLSDARETLSDVRRAIGAWKNEGIRLAAMRVKSERDEALEQAAQLREKYRIHHDEAERITAEIFEVRKQRDRLAEACQKLMNVVGPPNATIEQCWAGVDEIDEAWEAGKTALDAVDGGSNE